MASSSEEPDLKEIDGIDLSNYVRDPNSYNPVVYIHKRNLKRSRNDKDTKKPKKMINKSQQFNSENVDCAYNINVLNEVKRDKTTERTINFAKTLIPITIPPKPEDENVYYTVEATKKSKTQNKGCKCNLDKSNHDHVQPTKKERTKSKKDTTTKQCLKARTDTTTQSSDNTGLNSDDTQNHSLSELSELSDTKILKESPNRSKLNSKKIIASPSFEALAEEHSDVGKIKMQIMNDKERQILYESICIPLVNAVKDTISANENSTGFSAMKNKIDKFSDKLDVVLGRLNEIEEKLNRSMINKLMSMDNVRNMQEEQHVERDGRIEEDCHSLRETKKVKKRHNRDDISIQDVEVDIEGRGERVPDLDTSSSFVGIAPTPVHRKPARFCWTDSKLN